MENVRRVGDIRAELWRMLPFEDAECRVQHLQEEANKIQLELAGKSEDNYGQCDLCSVNITYSNLAKDEVGIITLYHSSSPKLMCKPCNNKLDDIDWDEVRENGY